MKRTFEAEDAAWNYKKERSVIDHKELEAMCAPYWQPMRLEKLLSRDQRYALGYPTTLPDLCRDYVADLEKESEIEELTLKIVKKNVFRAMKAMMAEKGYAA